MYDEPDLEDDPLYEPPARTWRDAQGAEEATRLKKQAQARAVALVNPDLLARIMEFARECSNPISPRPEVPLAVNRSITKFDIARWRIQATQNIRELEISDDISDALGENAPQALLRDLYRAVRPDYSPPWELMDTGRDPGGLRNMARVRVALDAARDLKLPDDPTLHEQMVDEREYFRMLRDQDAQHVLDCVPEKIETDGREWTGFMYDPTV